MVYGVGVSSEKGRCFMFFEDLMQCTQEAELPLTDCQPWLDDYLECLHRTKEKARMIEVIRRLRDKQRSGQLSADL